LGKTSSLVNDQYEKAQATYSKRRWGREQEVSFKVNLYNSEKVKNPYLTLFNPLQSLFWKKHSYPYQLGLGSPS
jgi:hypothetical protein